MTHVDVDGSGRRVEGPGPRLPLAEAGSPGPLEVNGADEDGLGVHLPRLHEVGDAAVGLSCNPLVDLLAGLEGSGRSVEEDFHVVLRWYQRRHEKNQRRGPRVERMTSNKRCRGGGGQTGRTL